MSRPQPNYRRELLKFLAASPLLTSYEAFAQEVEETLAERLKDPSEVINIFEMEAIAREKIPPSHFGYLISGTDGDTTLHANREGYTRFQIRPRRLVDVAKIDTRLDLLGAQADSPIILSPVGSCGAFHRDAETGAARASAAKGSHMIISTQASDSIEEVMAARDGKGLWFQLYSTNVWDNTVAMLQRAERAGCTTVCFTIDLPGGRNVETQTIWARKDTRFCEECHYDGKQKPMFEGLARSGLVDPALTWEVIGRMKDATRMNVVVKGLETAEDAALAVEAGVDGIFVSNHGGRATDTGRGTIECLPEVLAAVNGRVPVLVDGGIRRGTDVFKALALGASAVGIGRPYCWGLGAFGEAGVERVIDLLNREFAICMRGSGTTSLAGITNDYVMDAGTRVIDHINRNPL
ncbi:MAG TPA: alpha-hydroxy acid oxidase [Hyphomicrobiales bacterium]|nr:alpha-hydroxy acid oxidase [Hyphomicrobiales bacterium]